MPRSQLIFSWRREFPDPHLSVFIRTLTHLWETKDERGRPLVGTSQGRHSYGHSILDCVHVRSGVFVLIVLKKNLDSLQGKNEVK